MPLGKRRRASKVLWGEWVRGGKGGMNGRKEGEVLLLKEKKILLCAGMVGWASL